MKLEYDDIIKKRREYQRKYYQKHRDKLLVRQKEYRKKNREKYRAYSLEYFYRNREKLNEHRKKHYWDNVEKYRSMARKYREKNPNKSKEWYKKKGSSSQESEGKAERTNKLMPKKPKIRSHMGSIFKVVLDDDATPDHKLWAAVLYQAFDDLFHVETRSCSKKKRGEKNWGCCVRCNGKHHAKWWLKYSKNYFNSFPKVCEILGLDADKIRKRLIQMEVL